MTTLDAIRPVAVIGAGFSGTMAALHLLPRLGARAILLCERGERFGRGVAYATSDSWHLLNVRATNMSAFPDQPRHFLDWLDAHATTHTDDIHTTPAGTFVSRRIYGDYLASLLTTAVSGREGASRLILVPDEVVDLVLEPGGYQLVLAGGVTHRIAGAVLAAGNLLPESAGSERHVADPWTVPFTEGLQDGAPVVIVGTGLTMVDIALHLRHAGFGGPVVALSRRGLQPQPHAAAPPWPLPSFSKPERRSPARLLRRLRQEIAAAAAQGLPWQSVIDSVRQETSEIWRGIQTDQQGSFLRHARPWWDVHRHRMSPPVSAALDTMTATGFLTVRAGHIVDIEEENEATIVHFRPRGTAEIETIAAQRIIEASGSVAPDRCGMPLLQRLTERGLVRLDRHRLGFDQADDLSLIGASGEKTPGLWGLGPLGTGAFWECVAVPDIRLQAVRVADGIARGLGETHS